MMKLPHNQWLAQGWGASVGCDLHGLFCSPPSRTLAFFVSLIGGMVITPITTWVTHGGVFKREYMFAGTELAAISIVTAITIVGYFVQALFCLLDGGAILSRVETLSTEGAGSFLLVFLAVRIYIYCRNQRNRAMVTGLSLVRALRNSLVGSASLTTTALTLQAWFHVPK